VQGAEQVTQKPMKNLFHTFVAGSVRMRPPPFAGQQRLETSNQAESGAEGMR
jgi:hypothetical protein